MTKLEKMAEIYRLTGIEPDKEVVTDVSCKQSSWEDEALINWSYAEDGNGEAYYTESQLWEMGGVHSIPMLPEFLRVGMSLHDSLINLVLWGIYKGHIKKAVKEDE